MNISRYGVRFNGIQMNPDGTRSYMFECYRQDLKGRTFTTKRMSHLAIILAMRKLRKQVKEGSNE